MRNGSARFDLVDAGGDSLAAVHEISLAEIQQAKDHAAGLRGVGHTGTKDMKLAAQVPDFVVYDWCNKRGIKFQEFIRDDRLVTAFLDDPDNKAFRIWEGKI
jgi:hypothetical protein